MRPIDAFHADTPGWLLALAASAIAGLIGLVIFATRPSASPVAPKGVRVVAPAGIPTPPESASIPRPTRSASRPVSAALQREFLATTDLFAFAVAARKRPAEGGVFYATQAASYCTWANPVTDRTFGNSITAQIDVTSTLLARQSSELETYRRRCAGFASGVGESFHRDLATEAASANDPLLASIADLRKSKRAGDREASVRSLKAVLDLHDPLLVSTHYVLLAQPGAVGATASAWFEDREYRSPAEQGLFWLAMEIASCQPDAPCAGDNLRVLTCVQRGWCADTTLGLYFHTRTVDEQPMEDSEGLRDLVDRMRAALVRSDVDAFRSPHTSAPR